ncbi:hypothetical protein [Micromonospora purpureochromogenes]|uniref:Uncharacterized protein n=1 Tax=Micromonospora purpureochromogenes TaxID=47872 RepID=A0ABX2RRU1_9ACTN|nr:hypothetical protein [Micromonospora purpureochromogenes]NYF57954.1 hypothetical protein [Micromonospora purpureochromogenes]
MAERWSVVMESDVLSCAGVPAQSLSAENVTYVVGPSATLVIMQAGDRPDGNAVQSFDGLELREPFPEAAAARLSSSEPPLLGFVRVHEGYVPLGKLRNAVSRHKPMNIDGSRWPFGGTGELTWCRLHIADRLPFDVLDQVRPTPQHPLPGIDWLRFLPHDPVPALSDFVAAWYADLPAGDDAIGEPDRVLPEPLLAFYRAAAGRREVFGLHNEIYTADELEDEDDGRAQFGAENQGVFVMLMDPTEADPTVQYEGLHAEREREPLSGFLLQFLLCEASYSSPFTGFATVTAEQVRRLVEPLHRVPLQPMRWPGDPTRHYVADGLVVTTAASPDGSIEVYAGSRHRSALRRLRDPGFVWERFDG